MIFEAQIAQHSQHTLDAFSEAENFVNTFYNNLNYSSTGEKIKNVIFDVNYMKGKASNLPRKQLS